MMDYGLIGNCRTCALIGKDASIDWMCYPDFSSPSIFGRILDRRKGGSLSIRPTGKYSVSQQYIEKTAILETVFQSRNHAFKVIDFFPRYKRLIAGKFSRLITNNYLVRIIQPIRGQPRLRVKYDPRPDYARNTPEGGTEQFKLESNLNIETIMKSGLFMLDHSFYFAMGNPNALTMKKCKGLLASTRNYWRRWVETLVLPETNKEIIIRSAITLKLLTFSETGAIIAAPTTSLPEEVGNVRNYDYRYCWVRDAAFCADAFKKIGRDYEAKKLMEFIIKVALRDDHIQVMYGIRGETRLEEKMLSHLSGFKGSRPVRIGNAANRQRQHDIYGSIIDIFYLYFVYYEYERVVRSRYWGILKYAVNQIKFNWDSKDNGIWEFREKLEHFTYSKLMCYIGVDRAIKIAQHFGKDESIGEWTGLREEIREDLLRNGWSKARNAFTMHYGSRYLDASLLLMTYHEFLEKNDPRLIDTIKAIYTNLRRDDLVMRYKVRDDFGISKSAFTVCSFWLIDALYYIGEVEKARRIFDRIIARANHLGLFSEDMDLKTKALLGNFPQAYTHIALINSSILLSEWSAKRKKIDWSKVQRKKWF